MTTTFLPVRFETPLVNPSPTGLWAATTWADEGDPLRWLPDGVEFDVFNYGGGHGVWGAPWCAAEDDLEATDIKRSPTRPAITEPFLAVTLWGADECDLTDASRDEVHKRAQQALRMNEQTDTEAAFAERVLADVTPTTVDNIVDAVGFLEASFALRQTTGLIHASARLAATASQAALIRYSGSKMLTPLGHQWVFGGGYVDAGDQDGLGLTLVATSPTYGWRGSVDTRGVPKLETNRYGAVSERPVLIGYEAAIGAATIE